MMKKNKIRILTSLLTVVFCFTIYSTIAFAASSEEEYIEPTPEVKETPRSNSTPLTPDGNLTLVDDVEGEQAGDRQLGFTAEQTLEYAQSLYEKKLITYPRTDSRYLTEDMKSNTPAVVNASAGFFMPKNAKLLINTAQVIDNSKVSDHHAIIPTMSVKDCDIDSLPFGEREILLLIALRLMCAVGESFRYTETIVRANCNDTIFIAKGRTVLADGFKAIEKLYLATKNKQPKEDKDRALPPVNQGEVFTVSSTIKEGKTSPPRE